MAWRRTVKSLGSLVQLPRLRHLKLGRLWSVPDVLHSLAQLDSLELAVYGTACKAPSGSLDNVGGRESWAPA
jgi:hypothetical protein